MPEAKPVPIDPPPGVVKTETDRVVEGRFKDSQWVRFVGRKAEKRGGFEVRSEDPTVGIPRALHAWRALNARTYIGAGTYKKLYVYESDFAQHDITPVRETGTLGANPFTTTAGSSVVTVADSGHGLRIGDTVIFSASSAVNGHAWTAAGNAQIDTAIKKFGTAALLADGTGDWVTTADDTDWTISTGPLTVDLWFNCAAASGSAQRIAGQAASGLAAATGAWYLERHTTDVIRAHVSNGSSWTTVTGTTTITAAGWHHLALVWTGTVLKLFIDGTQEGGNVSFAGPANNSANALRVGAAGEETTSPWTGSIDEFRLSVGTSRWTANFTAPTSAHTSDEYTKVLLHFDGTDAATTITDSAGISPNGEFSVSAITNSGVYTVDSGTTAPITTVGGGAAVAYIYEVTIGNELSAFGLGYGVGGYGLDTWGDEREGSTLVVDARVWSIKNYGELLIAAYNGGTIYTFDPADLSTNGRAEELDNAPDDVLAMFITEERFPFALCEDLVVRWPDQEDLTIWTPADDNTSNERRLSEGTKLVGGIALGQRLALVFSDAACYIFQYTGSTAVYDSRKIGSDCGLIGPNAACVTSEGLAYWMSPRSFHYFDGAVHEVPNVEDIKSYVFTSIRNDQPYLCWCYYDASFHEVTFFYVLVGQSDPAFSVTYHIKDQCWSTNDWTDFPRASATRFQQGESRPYLGGTDGLIYLHEEGYNADGAAIETSLTLAPVAINKGEKLIDLDGVRVDLQDQSEDVTLTLEGFDSLRAAAIDSQTKTVTETDDLVDFRISGRYVGLELTSNEVDGYFRWGTPVALVKDNGARR